MEDQEKNMIMQVNGGPDTWFHARTVGGHVKGGYAVEYAWCHRKEMLGWG